MPFLRDKISYELDDLKEDVEDLSKEKDIDHHQIELANSVIDVAIDMIPTLTLSKIIRSEKSGRNVFEEITDPKLKEIMNQVMKQSAKAIVANSLFYYL